MSPPRHEACLCEQFQLNNCHIVKECHLGLLCRNSARRRFVHQMTIPPQNSAEKKVPGVIRTEKKKLIGQAADQICAVTRTRDGLTLNAKNDSISH